MSTIILKAGWLWDGIAEHAIADGAVAVSEGVIKAAGWSDEIMTMPHDDVSEWPGATLMPGLIDSHTHLSMDASLDNYLDHMSDPVPELAIRATAMMARDLRAGVTTCRCLGDKEFLDIAFRRLVKERLVDGPRLLVATRGIRSPRGHGFVGYPFDGPDEIRRAIRENIEHGADFIKIYITGTLKGTGNLPSYLSREEIRLAIEDAHAAGKRVASHCVGGEGLDWAMELGLDTVEHAYQITDDQVKKLAQSQSMLVLTPGAVLNDEVVSRLPANLIQGHRDEREQMFKNMAKTVAAGIHFGVGTDGFHGELAKDIQYLVELGATRVEALRAATIYGARVCDIENKTGSLEKGKSADIIAVEGNPLDDIGALRKIRMVMKEGAIAHPLTSPTTRGASSGQA